VIGGQIIAAGGDLYLTDTINVFAHLAYDKDLDKWRAARASGRLVGRNDETPYGYGRAAGMGCSVAFSQSMKEGRLDKLKRLACRALLGFDLVHAQRQSERLLAADIVWTHTESQFLAVAAMLRGRPHRPKLIAQAVWLLDRWPRLTIPHRMLFRSLIESVDVLTTLSPANAEAARKLFPQTRVEVMPFGLTSTDPIEPALRPSAPIQVLAVGNDRHRDWKTLVLAVDGLEGARLQILSGTVPKSIARDGGRVSVRSAKTNAELFDAFARANIAVVPLVPNLHASGITAIEEAVMAGIPVIASDVGGLRYYFDDSEICYVPAGDAAALRAAITHLSSNADAAIEMARRAQLRVLDKGLNIDGYISRHVELSKDLLGRG
jgi:glycosyltransferase involved in cell wall biosynthesis